MIQILWLIIWELYNCHLKSDDKPQSLESMFAKTLAEEMRKEIDNEVRTILLAKAKNDK